MVAKENKGGFEMYLQKLGLKMEIVIDNVADAIKKQQTPANGGFAYSKYNTLDDIYGWIDQMKHTYNDYVTVLNIGKSYEGRDLKAMKISISSNSSKKALWFDGGIHAREWIAPATVIYIAYSVGLLI
jgi:murein tripeptide amidase MpaA